MLTNRIRILTLAALLFSAMLIIAAAVLPPVSGNATQTSGSIADDEQTVYTVRSYGNEIGIFKNGNDFPVKTISVNPKSLPQDAQTLLEKGITVSSRDELLLLIEDYIS